MVLNLKFCNSLVSLPESFGRLKHLRILNLEGCTRLRVLCSNFGMLQSVTNLNFTICPIKQADFPSGFEGLGCLRHLFMQGRHLIWLPKDFSNLTTLVHLDMGWSLALVDIPGSLSASLEILDLRGCTCLRRVFTCLRRVFPGGKKLAKLKKLILENCSDLRVVQEWAHMPTLEKTNLDGYGNWKPFKNRTLSETNLKQYNSHRSKARRVGTWSSWPVLDFLATETQSLCPRPDLDFLATKTWSPYPRSNLDFLAIETWSPCPRPDSDFLATETQSPCPRPNLDFLATKLGHRVHGQIWIS